MENSMEVWSMEVPQEIKNRTIIWPNNPAFGYRARENEISISKRYLYSMFIAALFMIAKV